MFRPFYFLAIFLVVSIAACNETTNSNQKDNFDRTEILENWVDNKIKPAFADYVATLNALQLALAEFENNETVADLDHLRATYIEAYLAWQKVSMFEIGQAQILNLRGFTNIFPADIEKISTHITSGSYNLELPSNFATQGFPAIDYLLFQVDDKNDLVNKLREGHSALYLRALVERLTDLATTTNDGWTSDFRSSLIDEPDAVDRIVNDYIFYFEKFLRAGKVGIPAGVFSGDPISTAVEAPFSGTYSKDLLLEALDAVQDFFNGQSLNSYLEFMNKADIAREINEHWNTARELINSLDPNLKSQVENDPIAMLEVYDELQKAVILLKVDMLQALSIQVDYVDADGD